MALIGLAKNSLKFLFIVYYKKRIFKDLKVISPTYFCVLVKSIITFDTGPSQISDLSGLNTKPLRVTSHIVIYMFLFTTNKHIYLKEAHQQTFLHQMMSVFLLLCSILSFVLSVLNQAHFLSEFLFVFLSLYLIFLLLHL